MRLVIVNPHVYPYGKCLFHTIFGQKNFCKYKYFIDYFINNRQRKVAFFVNTDKTSLVQSGVRFGFILPVIVRVELFVWMLINGINPFKQKIIFNDLKELNHQDDVVFNFARGGDNNQFAGYDGLVISHLTHYHMNPSVFAEQFDGLKHGFLMAEANLKNNIFFRKFFGDKEVYQLPFTFSSRFRKFSPDFSLRKNKCFAVGTLTGAAFKDYGSFYGENAIIHPMRKKIFESKNDLADVIDCFIQNADDTNEMRKPVPGDGLLAKWARVHLPYFILCKVVANFKNSYYKFNIVEKYNEYKMFISPEERMGLFSMNIFEGMACGTAFVGIDNPMYTNLGMVDGENYIAYKEDDLNDLVQKIKFYQAPENQEKLAKIADNGYQFVREKLSPKVVADTFWQDLEHLTKTFNEGKAEFKCSFKRG